MRDHFEPYDIVKGNQSHALEVRKCAQKRVERKTVAFQPAATDYTDRVVFHSFITGWKGSSVTLFANRQISYSFCRLHPVVTV